MDIGETESVLTRAHQVQALGVKSKDALHIACAIESTADYFIATEPPTLRYSRRRMFCARYEWSTLWISLRV